MNLPNRVAVGLASFLLLGGGANAQAGWRTLYSEGLMVTPPQATAQERALLGRAAPLLGTCPGETAPSIPRLIGRAPGPFLKAGTQETALVYQLCEEFMADTLGLIITRAGQPVLHLAFEGSAISEVYSVLDINRDGLRELAMLENFADAGSGEAWLNVWDFRGVAAGGLPTTPYRFLTATENCEVGLPANVDVGNIRHYHLWVKLGRTPAFKANERGANGCNSKPLLLLRTGIQPVKPNFPAPIPTRQDLP